LLPNLSVSVVVVVTTTLRQAEVCVVDEVRAYCTDTSVAS